MYELAIEQRIKKKDMQASITHREKGQVEGGGGGARDEEKDNRWQCKQARTIPHIVKDKTAMCMKCFFKKKKKTMFKVSLSIPAGPFMQKISHLCL